MAAEAAFPHARHGPRQVPPSPTGDPHVGNVRTAIFNWLFARGAGGSFVIRIEDTDQSRKVEGAVESILETLRWLGVDWDEGPDVGGDYGPYVQSERLDLYRAAADDLLAAGRAYECHCGPERLDDLRREQGRRKGRVGYDGRCRDPRAREKAAAEGGPPVVRFMMPGEGSTSIRDIVRGEVTFDNALIDDFVILKSDGFPTYHLASVVDDSAMRISHVLRAEEWLPSAPRHVLLYRALGLDLPLFAHLPIILAPDRSKLSKRHGATSALEYREMGYVPQAMVNFLTLLGWSLDDRTEIFSRDDLFASFLAGARLQVRRRLQRGQARVAERALHPRERPGGACRRAAGLLGPLPPGRHPGAAGARPPAQNRAAGP